MEWSMNKCEEEGMLAPVAIHGAVWDSVKRELDQIPHVEFNFFWPSTISESVAESGSAANKIFFGFMLCASLCLMASDYTIEFETVDLPGVQIPVIGINFNTMRAWFPPIGLILLSAVPMVPESQIKDFPDTLLTIVHLVGAQFCFVVYLGCEAWALYDSKNSEEMEANHPSEWYFRFALCLIGAIAMQTFVAAWACLFLFSASESTPFLSSAFAGWGGYSDLYKHSFNSGYHRLRPAEGVWKTIKVISYTAEFIVSMSILLNMYTIWWFYQKPYQRFKNRARQVMGYEDEER
jgi:hypothetical protein